MRQIVKKATGVLLALSITAGSAMNSLAAGTMVVSYGDEVNFSKFMVANTDDPDVYDSVSKNSEEDNGGASAGTGTPSIDGEDHGVGTNDWSWADWLNDGSTWKDPITNGVGKNGGSGSNGSGSGSSGLSSPNNINGYDMSDPFAGHRKIESMFHRAPSNSTSLENLMAKGGADTKVTRMSLDEFLAMVGDNEAAIRAKYEAMKKEAESQQQGDADLSMKLLNAMVDAFKNGVNAWTGLENMQPPDVSDWLKQVTDTGILDLVDILADLTQAQHKPILGPNQAMIDLLLEHFKAKYTMFMNNGYYSGIPHVQIPEDQHDQFQMVVDGYFYENGKKTDIKLSEYLASDADNDVYIYTIDGKTEHCTTGDLVEMYGSVEAAKEKIGDLKTVNEIMTNKDGSRRSFSDLSEAEQTAIKGSGIYMESCGMTISQALEKYGGDPDKMPTDVRDEYETNLYLAGKLDQAYPPSAVDVSSTNEQVRKIAEKFPTYDSMPEDIQNMITEDQYDKVLEGDIENLETMNRALVGDRLREALRDGVSYEEAVRDGNLTPGAEYLTKSEYEEWMKLYREHPEYIEDTERYPGYIDKNLKLHDHKMNSSIGINDESKVIDVPYYCKVCKSFLSSKFPCKHHIYNHTQAMYEAEENGTLIEDLATRVSSSFDFGGHGAITYEDMDPSSKSDTIATYMVDPNTGKTLYTMVTNEGSVESYVNPNNPERGNRAFVVETAEDVIYQGLQDGSEYVFSEKPFNPSIPTVFAVEGLEQEKEIFAQYGISVDDIGVDAFVGLYMSDFGYKYGEDEKAVIRKMMSEEGDYVDGVNASLIAQDIEMLSEKEIDAAIEELIKSGVDPTSYDSVREAISKQQTDMGERQTKDETLKKMAYGNRESWEEDFIGDPNEDVEAEIDAYEEFGLAADLGISNADAQSKAKRIEAYQEIHKEHTREDSLILAALSRMERQALEKENEKNEKEFKDDFFLPLMQALLDWGNGMANETTMPSIMDVFNDFFDTEAADFEEKVQQAYEAIDEELAQELEDYKNNIIEQYEKYCDELDAKYAEGIPDDPSLWTGEDVEKAREAIEKTYADQKIPDMDSFGDDVPRIQDSAEYKEDSVEKIIKNWPADKALWNEGMKSFYKQITDLSKDPAFAKTFAEMDAQGVFDSDDPNEIIKNMQAYVNGFTTHTSKAGKEYVYVYGTITASGVMDIEQRKDFNVVGTTIVKLVCLTDPNYGTRYGYRWTADQIGTFRATGQYEVTHCYSQTRGYIAHYSLSAKLPNGEMIDIMTRDEQVILADESGVKAENTTVNYLDPLIIEVVAGDIDLKKTDFYNTKRIQ